MSKKKEEVPAEVAGLKSRAAEAGRTVVEKARGSFRQLLLAMVIICALIGGAYYGGVAAERRARAAIVADNRAKIEVYEQRKAARVLEEMAAAKAAKACAWYQWWGC